MRIRNIILDSFFLPAKKIKQFLLITLLAFFCELISAKVYSTPLGQLSVPIMIFNAAVTIVLLGVMMNITYQAVCEEDIGLNPKEHLIEGIKEYIVTFFYLMLSFIVGSLFSIPTGVYRKLMHLNEYIAKMDFNTTFMTLHELSHQFPVDLHLNLQHSIQLNVIISILIFILFMSIGFIGKILLLKTGRLISAFDFHKIGIVINNIGVKRFLKFILCMGVVFIVVFNVIMLLEYLYVEVIFSAILEAFTLVFSTNAFYLLYFHNTPG